MFDVNPLAEDSHKISSLIFSENIEKVFKAIICCSPDWRMKALG